MWGLANSRPPLRFPHHTTTSSWGGWRRSRASSETQSQSATYIRTAGIVKHSEGSAVHLLLHAGVHRYRRLARITDERDGVCHFPTQRAWPVLRSRVPSHGWLSGVSRRCSDSFKNTVIQMCKVQKLCTQDRFWDWLGQSLSQVKIDHY